MAIQELVHKDGARKTLVCATCDGIFTRFPSQCGSKHSFCSRACVQAFGTEDVGCSWPECSARLIARKFRYSRGGFLWKTDLKRKGQAVRWPLCQRHRDLAYRYLPAGQRFQNGRLKWFVDPSTNLGHRGITSVATRLILWAKTDGCCAHCSSELDFSETPRAWHIDHKVPIFKGGTTNYWNLEPLCFDCHMRKSFGEKSEASRNRHREHKVGRWLTHPEKDALIAALRSEVDSLRARLREQKESRQCRRKSASTKSSPVGRILPQTTLPF